MELGVAGLVAFTMVWVLLIRGLLKQRKNAPGRAHYPQCAA